MKPPRPCHPAAVGEFSQYRRGNVVEFISQTIDRLGYLGIFLLMLIETLVPPIPSEVIMPLVGVAAVSGRLSLFGATLAAIAGATAGATAWYLAARAYGPEWLVAAGRHGRWLGLTSTMLHRPTEWFARRGGWTVFLARILPGMRVYISVPAGLAGMSLPRFLAFTSAGYSVWYGLLGTVGYALGLNAERLVAGLAVAAPWLWAALLLFIGWQISGARRRANVAP